MDVMKNNMLTTLINCNICQCCYFVYGIALFQFFYMRDYASYLFI